MQASAQLSQCLTMADKALPFMLMLSQGLAAQWR